MAAGDIYHISGDLQGRRATAFLGGNVDDGIQIDAFAAARVAANDTAGTFTAWINVPDITGTYTIIGCGDASAVEYMHFSIEAGKLWAAGAKVGPNVAWDINSTNVVITPHKWHHVAFKHSGAGGRVYMYIDGEIVAMTDTDVTEAAYWFDDFSLIDGAHIGAADSIAGGALLTQEFKGAISDVKYWAVALTDAQVKDDYEGKIPEDITGTAADLISWWDMDGDYIDSVAGHNGTAVGDIILDNNFSEFTSRLKYTCTAPPVVADDLSFSCDRGVGHAIVVKAA